MFNEQEYLSFFRPYELFCECYSYYQTIEFLKELRGDRLVLSDAEESELERAYECHSMFYKEIERRCYCNEYAKFVIFVEDNEIG